MTDFIITIILIAIVSGAVFYIWKAKRSGKKCIGCPYANDCVSKNHCNCQDS